MHYGFQQQNGVPMTTMLQSFMFTDFSSIEYYTAPIVVGRIRGVGV